MSVKEQSKTQTIQVLGRQLTLNQIEGGFWTSMDSVFLSAACKIKAGETLLDIGCGVGGAGLCVVERMPNVKLTGIDIQADHIEVAKENAALNDHKEACTFIESDIRDYKTDTPFDHVICNPPYLEAGTYLISPSEAKAKAHGHLEEKISVYDWVKCGHAQLKSGGSFSIIHRADNTDKIIRAMGRRFGAIEIVPLWPKAQKDAKRVIVRGIKDRKSPSRLHRGYILHKEDGEYTDEANTILHGQEIIE